MNTTTTTKTTNEADELYTRLDAAVEAGMNRILAAKIEGRIDTGDLGYARACLESFEA